MPKVLYMNEASPPARAVMMVVDILGLDFDQKVINPVLRDQDAPDLKKKNPMRTIPILDEGDYSLADSHAIMIYLLESYGKPEHANLYPSDKRKRATLHQRLFFDCGVLFPRLRAVMAPTYSNRLTEMSKNMIYNIENAYSILEAYLEETKYIADDVITLADISIVATMGSLDGLRPVDEKRYPKLKSWLANMNEQEYCKKINVPGSELHVYGLKLMMEHNAVLKKSKSKL